MAFAERLRALRLAKGMTQEQLAAKSGQGLSTIRNYEQGWREPLLSTAFKLADALGVSVEELKNGNDGPARPQPRGRPPKKAKARKDK
jgi:transcriptional regulator with XRE-family HTH domain